MATGVLSAAWVDREAELGLLAGATRSVVAGRGGAVLVVGEPGIGKSALVARGLAGLPAACRVVFGAADELTGRFPLLVLTDALRVSAAAVSAGAAPWAVGDPVLAAVERVLSRVDELCAAGPVVLVVEDLHWADEASLLAFSRLVRAVRQQPLLLVGTARPVPPRPELGQLRRSLAAGAGAVVELGPLPEADSIALAGHLVGAAAGPRLGRLAAAAAGNPLYLREALDAAGRDGRIAVRAGVADLAGPRRPVVSLAGAISDRLAFLSADTAEALRAATLLGGDIAVTDLAAVTGRSAAALVAVVDEALASGVLIAAGDKLRFRHALIRDALYGSMPEAIRSALHRQAAQALAGAGMPPERAAQQLLAAPAAVDAWATAWLVEHADALVQRAPGTAEELLVRVVEQPLPDESRRDGLELALATAAFRRSSTELLERVAGRMLARTADPERRCHVGWLLAYTLLRTGRFDQGLRVVGEVAAGSSVSAAWRARFGALTALLLYGAGRHEQTRAEAEAALAAARGCGDRIAEGYALHALSLEVALLRDTAGALRLVDEALGVVAADAELIDLRVLLLLNRLHWSSHLDLFAEAEDALRTARSLADSADLSRVMTLTLNAAQFYYAVGRWDDALAELESAAFPPDESYYSRLRDGLGALIAVRRGRSDGAVELLAEGADEPVVAASLRANDVFVLRARAVAAERAGDVAGALRLLRPTIDPAADAAMDERYLWLPDLVRLARSEGEEELARAAADVAAAESEREPTHGGRSAAARWCAALLSGDVTALDECAEHFRAVGRLPALGGVLEAAAACAAAAGDVVGARPRLAGAVEVYLGLGAEWDVRRADARLRALGVRRGQRSGSRRPVSGWAALTPTEVRVAELVAQGRSNPEVAAVLFLSRRTVQTHVTHILAKLGIHARGEIASALDRPGT